MSHSYCPPFLPALGTVEFVHLAFKEEELCPVNWGCFSVSSPTGSFLPTMACLVMPLEPL